MINVNPSGRQRGATDVSNLGSPYGRPQSNGHFRPENWFTAAKIFSSRIYQPWEYKLRTSDLTGRAGYLYELIPNPDGAGGLVLQDEVDVPSNSFGQGPGEGLF